MIVHECQAIQKLLIKFLVKKNIYNFNHQEYQLFTPCEDSMMHYCTVTGFPFQGWVANTSIHW